MSASNPCSVGQRPQRGGIETFLDLLSDSRPSTSHLQIGALFTILSWVCLRNYVVRPQIYLSRTWTRRWDPNHSPTCGGQAGLGSVSTKYSFFSATCCTAEVSQSSLLSLLSPSLSGMEHQALPRGRNPSISRSSFWTLCMCPHSSPCVTAPQ